MIQCKREKEIGPKKLKAIIQEIDSDDPPYGYILAASTHFSKRSYDLFRQTLIEKGVMEFYLWVGRNWKTCFTSQEMMGYCLRFLEFR
jgi:hypothetical protein